jgi:hypothetical protein
VALLRGHFGVRLHACVGPRSANDAIRASFAGGFPRGIPLDGVDPLVPMRNAYCGAHPPDQVKIRSGSLICAVF